MEKRLSERQKAFVREYLVDLNASAAAIRAGYSERRGKQRGHELLLQPHVAAAVREALDRRAEEAEDSAERVVRDLLRASEGALEARDFRALGKLMELRLKHLGMLTDRVRVEGDGGGPPVVVLRWADGT